MIPRLLKGFEKSIVIALVGMMMVMILLATLELGWIILQEILKSPNYLPEINGLLDIFGFFLLILIGVELLETIKAYLTEHVVHVEIVLEVALIAVARKVVILDVKDVTPLTIFSIAALVAALAIAFYLEKRGRLMKAENIVTRKSNPIPNPENRMINSEEQL